MSKILKGLISFFKKHLIISIIVGSILLVCGVYMLVMDINKQPTVIEVGSLQINIVSLTLGILMLIIANFIILPFARKKVSGQGLYIVEYVLFTIIAIVGFMLDKGLGIISFPFNYTFLFWVGCLVLVHGAVELYVCSYAKERQSFSRYIFGLLLVIVGCYLLFDRVNFDRTAEIIIIWTCIIVGILMLTGSITTVASKKRGK